jgi:hypothetical protein
MRDKWLNVNLYDERNKPKISRIIQIEMEITEAIRNGHKAFWGDQFREKRNEMLQLRKELLEGK